MLTPLLTRWMRPRLVPAALGLLLAPLGAVLVGQGGPEPVRGRATAVAASGDTAASWGQRIQTMERTGSLRLRSSVEDTMLEGRVHDRFDQYAGEARIFGAQLVRQRSAAGVESVFGNLYPDDLGISTTPTLTPEDAVARVVAIAGHQPIAGRQPELVVLPRDDGTFRLTWLSRVRTANDIVALFVDAKTGEEVWRYTLIQRQSAVGTGTGVLGDRKKLSTRQASNVFLADDALRPPMLITYDLKGNFQRVFDILDGITNPAQSDVATDSDNTWTDGASVDAHAYIGFTYDFYFQRFGRHGLDGNNRAIRSIVHPAPREDPLSLPPDVIDNFLLNAFWCGDCGQPGQGYMVFGEGVPTRFSLGGQNFNYFAAGYDVVAHELTHGVTEFTSGLIYENESGALNESFSDIMGTAAEYYVSATKRSDRPPDYLIGEDIVTPARPGALTGIRSMSDPGSFGDPDHYSRRYTGREDSGGVHTNSGISNHAYFLAIEGGTNRTSGLAVTGVGGANREQIDRIFYRAFTSYLTPGATFAQARQATLRAASELFGDSSAAFRAVQQAWTAVGVN
jgi:bacillolysin